VAGRGGRTRGRLEARARETGDGRAWRLELGARLLEAGARRLEAAARREAVAAQIEGDAGD